MKKIILGLFTLAIATGANAQDNFEGWFVGAEVHQTKLALTEILDTKIGDTKGNKKTGLGVSGGFGWSYGSSNLITQIEAKYRTGGSSISSSSGEHDFVKENSSFSVSWLQGYRVADKFLPYIKVGGAAHSLQGDGEVFNTDGGVFGGTYGVGLKYAVTENIETGAEYTQTQLRDFNNDVKFKVNTLNLGVSYRF